MRWFYLVISATWLLINTLPALAANEPPVILFLGDSLTEGLGVSHAQAYPALIAKKLKTKGYPHRVINAGVSGDTSGGGLARTDWLLEEPNVAIMILALGSNDMLRGLPVGALEQNLSEMIAKAQKKQVIVLLVGMKAFYNLGAAYQKRFDKTYPHLSRRFKTALVPFLLEGIALNPKYNQPDGLHPNAQGHQQMAETVWQGLLPLLK